MTPPTLITGDVTGGPARLCQPGIGASRRMLMLHMYPHMYEMLKTRIQFTMDEGLKNTTGSLDLVVFVVIGSWYTDNMRPLRGFDSDVWKVSNCFTCIWGVVGL